MIGRSDGRSQVQCPSTAVIEIAAIASSASFQKSLRRFAGLGARTAVLALTEAEQSFVFRQVPENPVPSLLRGFSAPVHVRFAYTEAELAAT